MYSHPWLWSIRIEINYTWINLLCYQFSQIENYISLFIYSLYSFHWLCNILLLWVSFEGIIFFDGIQHLLKVWASRFYKIKVKKISVNLSSIEFCSSFFTSSFRKMYVRLTHLHILHTKQKPIINRIKKIIVPIKTPIINGEFKQNSIQIPKCFHELTSSSSASPKVTLLAPKSFSFVICPLRSESECSGRVLTNVFKFWWSLVKISVKSKQISKSNLTRKNVFHVKSPFSLQALLEEKEVLGILKKRSLCKDCPVKSRDAQVFLHYTMNIIFL